MVVLLICLGAGGALFLGQALLSGVGEIQTWQMERLARRVDLGIPADLDSIVRDRVRRRTLGGGVGGLLGLLVGGAGLLVADATGVLPFGAGSAGGILVPGFTVLVLAATGSATGVAMAALRAETVDDGEARIARLRVTTVGDFVPGILRAGGWIVLGLSAATLVLAVIGSGDGPVARFLPGVVLVAAGAAALTAFEVFSRRIVERGRPAKGTHALVWDDALRSEALRDLLFEPLRALALGTVYVLTAVGITGSTALALVPCCLALVVFLFVGGVLSNTRTWYRDRLWPGARRRTPDEEARRIEAVDLS